MFNTQEIKQGLERLYALTASTHTLNFAQFEVQVEKDYKEFVAKRGSVKTPHEYVWGQVRALQSPSW